MMRKEIWLLAIIIIAGVVIRLAVIPVFSGQYKPVDIYIVDEQASKLILNFQNPYMHSYLVHNYALDIFAYLPMVSIYYAPFSLLGDIRYGNIFADVLIMLAVYWIARSMSFRTALYAPVAFAILPWSIWLTSIASTNFMVGTAFLMLSLASMLRKKYTLAAVFLGLGVATNQLLVLLLPLYAYHYWTGHNFSRFIISLAVPAAIILPFFVSSPYKFFYDVAAYQFVRQLQSDGSFSLFSILKTSFGFQVSTWARVILFTVPFLALTFWFKHRSKVLAPSAGALLFLAAFILPVNGLWNYFLPSFALACLLIPLIGDYVDRKTQVIKWLPHFFPPDYNNHAASL